MVIALFILMVAAFLTAEYLFFSKKVADNVPVHSAAEMPLTKGTIERYFHPGHSWALVESSKPIVVGVSDFSQRFIGRIDSIEMPKKGTVLRQGETMVTLRRGKKTLSQVAPISGIVVETNARLNENPAPVNDSPLEKGWLIKISPRDLTLELRNVLKGVAADRWQEAVRMQLLHWFSPRLGTVMQDGGAIVDNVSDLVSDEEWPAIVNEFFPSVQQHPSQQ